MTSTLDRSPVDEDEIDDEDLDGNGSNETEMENDSNLDGLGLSKLAVWNMENHRKTIGKP
jgi:hypothetical protein